MAPGFRLMVIQPEKIISAAAGAGVTVTQVQAAQLARYVELMLDWNQRVNLTSITDPDEIVALHLADSLTVLRQGGIGTNFCLIDIGAGAGLPGIPIAIARPDLRVTLLEATEKKCRRFLEAAVAELALTNVTVLCARAEDAAHTDDLREQFDMAVVRAVGSVAVIAELTLPFLRIGGLAVLMKGPGVEQELERGRTAIGTLGGRLWSIHRFALDTPGGQAKRGIAVISKVEPTPSQYPRPAGRPAKRPLGIDRRAPRG